MRSFHSFLKRLRDNRKGNVLAMGAAAVLPIAAMIGSGLDMSRAYMAQAKMQNACDSAALAARRQMAGTVFDDADRAEGRRFFDFNFPANTMGAENTTVTIEQSTTDSSTVEVVATADVPTTLMSLFGNDEIAISVSCNADQDFGNNDIMVVLDVTGSMRSSPSTGGASKISRLRDGTAGLYRALQGASNTRTRYGMIPYSMSVNVARSLRTRDILRETFYLQCESGDPDDCTYRETELTPVHINDSQWAGLANRTGQRIRAFRESGDGCVEERPTIGEAAQPIVIRTDVSQADIDDIAANANDRERQWGRYDPSEQHAQDYSICPAEATRLTAYTSETSFQDAVDDATATVNGNTYHDLGIVWAARFLSSTGMFASNNPEEFNGVPVAKHIVFLTDGELCAEDDAYTSFGVEDVEDRIEGTAPRIFGCGNSTLTGLHTERFLSACDTARSMGMTIWVIAFDVTDTDDIEPCATSEGHFYTSDGSDLEQVFERIGQGIGRLRLTQ
ncbi:pilus assembly protein [Erythrobacter sp.]|nr:pilus assembly protein [Erythrobacter sp.]